MGPPRASCQVEDLESIHAEVHLEIQQETHSRQQGEPSTSLDKDSLGPHSKTWACQQQLLPDPEGTKKPGGGGEASDQTLTAKGPQALCTPGAHRAQGAKATKYQDLHPCMKPGHPGCLLGCRDHRA